MVSIAVLVSGLVLGGPSQVNAGELRTATPDGKPGVACALKHTSVTADIDGFGASVTVTQIFRNPNRIPMEAIYTFPLPQDAAVDQMRIEVGGRIIEGEIATRDNARRTYEAAKASGMTAALLDQERPNLFTQSVANLMPGSDVKVQIRYVQVLPFAEGQYEFNFPMVVGPRYTNANTPDPDKVTPPIIPPGMRTGAGIDVTVNLNAGAPIKALHSVLHKVTSRRVGSQGAVVTLAKADEIPNRDFILRFGVAEGAVQSSVVSNYVPGEGGTFALVLMPPKAVAPAQIAPKEMIFVMDQSGSQSGFPIEKSKELTKKLLKKMGPRDTFNVLGFSNEVKPLWHVAQPNTPKNVAAATKFVDEIGANGGTELEKAIVASLSAPADPERLRMVVFNTDGFAGQEEVILREIRKHRGSSRLFSFGIGNSVNRYLIDAMAVEGRGDMEVVTLAEQADGAVDRLYRRVSSPVLIQLEAEADGVSDLTPAYLPDVFLERPVVLFGRYSKPGPARISLRGTRGDGTPWKQDLDVTLSDRADAPAITSLWARRRIDDLVRSARNQPKPLEGELSAEMQVTRLALRHRLMSEYTSFVAVEKRVVNIGGKQKTVRVPVEMADGVQYPQDQSGFALARSATTALGASVKASAPVPGQISGGRAASAGPGGGGFGGGGAAYRYRAADALSANRAEYENPELKIAADLRKAKGLVEVQVLLSKWDDKVLKSLEALGLKVEGSDKALKVVFGTIDASKLVKLSKVDEVTAIQKI